MNPLDLKHLKGKWRIFIDTETARYDIPLEKLPNDFYTFIEPNGDIEEKNLYKLIKEIYTYNIVEPIYKIKIHKNIYYELANDFLEEDFESVLDKKINKLKQKKDDEIRIKKELINKKKLWDKKVLEDPHTRCRECSTTLYRDLYHYKNSSIRFVLCKNCSLKPLKEFCRIKYCTNLVTRSSVTGKSHPNCFNCFKNFQY